MATKIQIVFDCADPARVAGFWERALHYVSPPPPPPHTSWDEWARSEGIPEEQWNDARSVDDPGGDGPRLYFQKVPEPKIAKNRMHLDLNVGGGSSVPLTERRRRIDTEVVRLKKLGATDERGAMDRGDEYWVRMNDPEGNEFCIQ